MCPLQRYLIKEHDREKSCWRCECERRRGAEKGAAKYLWRLVSIPSQGRLMGIIRFGRLSMPGQLTLNHSRNTASQRHKSFRNVCFKSLCVCVSAGVSAHSDFLRIRRTATQWKSTLEFDSPPFHQSHLGFGFPLPTVPLFIAFIN